MQEQRVVHFELMVAEPERALRFYGEVFGWKADKWEGPQDYWLVTTGEDTSMGINGGIGRTQTAECPVQSVNVISVPSVDDYAEKITRSGGTIAMPKMEVPGVGFLAYATDTEGILFGIMEFATTPKG